MIHLVHRDSSFYLCEPTIGAVSFRNWKGSPVRWSRDSTKQGTDPGIDWTVTDERKRTTESEHGEATSPLQKKKKKKIDRWFSSSMHPSTWRLEKKRNQAFYSCPLQGSQSCPSRGGSYWVWFSGGARPAPPGDQARFRYPKLCWFDH